MATPANQPQKETNHDFGLPKTEFKPIAPRGSHKWLKITAIVMGIVLVVGVGVVYWLFQRSPSANNFIANTLKTHPKEITPADEKPEELDDALSNFNDQELVTEKPEFNEPTQPVAIAPEPASIVRLSVPQGLYYVVVASYIDVDLAMDYAKQLVKKGVQVRIIEPTKGKHFFRVAIAQGNTFREASEKAEELKALYGKQVWVLRY